MLWVIVDSNIEYVQFVVNELKQTNCGLSGCLLIVNYTTCALFGVFYLTVWNM